MRGLADLTSRFILSFRVRVEWGLRDEQYEYDDHGKG
jgi:hypothetical protein